MMRLLNSSNKDEWPYLEVAYTILRYSESIYTGITPRLGKIHSGYRMYTTRGKGRADAQANRTYYS